MPSISMVTMGLGIRNNKGSLEMFNGDLMVVLDYVNMIQYIIMSLTVRLGGNTPPPLPNNYSMNCISVAVDRQANT